MEVGNIPHIIHYCWFGKGRKPDYFYKYLESWKKFLPDYEIIEWNESNFDINYCNYTKDAYKMKKYAFVSDVARLYALKIYGGIYLDTDVEITKKFDEEILNTKCLFGFEVENRVATSFMACEKNSEFISELLETYIDRAFILDEKTMDLNITPNVVYLTDKLKRIGLIENGESQKLTGDISIYNREYFSPYDYINCVNDQTENTYCIHYFTVSWLKRSVLIKRKIKIVISKTLGRNFLIFLRKVKNSIVKS